MDEDEISILYDSLNFPFNDLTNANRSDFKSDFKKHIGFLDTNPSTSTAHANYASCNSLKTRNFSSFDLNLVDPSLEMIDPNPDVHSLFVSYNHQFFWGALDACTVDWSKRMTLCAGLCRFEGKSGLCSIKLSEPLLKLRPRSDLIETLLHEMIHAYLFVTTGHRDRDGHGPEFKEHMNRINDLASTNITVYHSFHDEVNSYKQHWWRCTGKCRKERPYYGWVKRSMNRAPGKNDFWWKDHQATCEGTFVKVKEPEPKLGKGKKERKPKREGI